MCNRDPKKICTYMYLCKLLRTYVRTERSVKETAKDGAKEKERESEKERGREEKGCMEW